MRASSEGARRRRTEHGFAPGVTAWRAGLGRARDAVRQELVSAIRGLAVDPSEELLDVARSAAAREPAEVGDRLCFERADLLHLGREHAGPFDVVCCHGVAMYLPS